MAKRFIITFILVVFVYGGFAGLNIGLVMLAGETRAYTDIAREQQDDPGTIYGPLFNNDHASYKYALLKERPADVIVVGSSRALQYRQAFFSKPMVNCGRIVASVRNTLNFFDQLSKDPKPRTVIVLADFWWFRKPLRKVTGGHVFTHSTGTERSLNMFYKPFWYMLNGKINLRTVMSDKENRIGFRARQNDIGFFPDGSYHDKEKSISYEAMLADMKARIGKQGLSYSTTLRQKAVDAFIHGVDSLQAAGHTVIVIFPPLSPAMHDILSANPKFGYIAKTTEYAKQFGAIDYHDPARLGLDTADFEDALHTSSRADAILLRDLARSNTAIRNVINHDFIEAFIASGKPTP
ncbi:hypothetical protein [Pseudodesulfovibrio sediminis]|uniref:Uncharacterized protein n=1 Tax=Pseudodesulfovibrio sediminis TaxID=2810563 RepID=A0ABN6EV05_9BACT|nr:hypothetical protein [Pseudodesulfovibrio sediminis]BCS89089.1 hypothetical protein PSDVSF_23310 [Pseudodesulfovibrio sediminis]